VKHGCGERCKRFFVDFFCIGEDMIKRLILLMIGVVALTGCESKDERLTTMAHDSVEQQKAQNQEMSRLNREVAQGVTQLVEAESESRKELIGLQHDLQDQQSEVNDQRDALEAERKSLPTNGTANRYSLRSFRASGCSWSAHCH